MMLLNLDIQTNNLKQTLQGVIAKIELFKKLSNAKGGKVTVKIEVEENK